MIRIDSRKKIETSRLRLRLFRIEDLTPYAAIMGDDEVGKWFPGGKGYTREQAARSLESILAHWKKYGFGIWAMTHKEEGILLGRCGLNSITETSEVEVDFAVASEFWGRGFATEAAKAALVYGFEVLNLMKIIGLTKPENVGSRRVMEKLGMRFTKDAQYWGIICSYYQISKGEYASKFAY